MTLGGARRSVLKSSADLLELFRVSEAVSSHNRVDHKHGCGKTQPWMLLTSIFVANRVL